MSNVFGINIFHQTITDVRNASKVSAFEQIGTHSSDLLRGLRIVAKACHEIIGRNDRQRVFRNTANNTTGTNCFNETAWRAAPKRQTDTVI